ncbi:MAG TPA: P1 family peptidase [Thermoplasmata archaeon]|nr:P1 family peptidase [Thermoplasmata archaeon]
MNSTLTALKGVRVGHAEDRHIRSGTTVVLLDPPAMAFADPRGGWPGSFDTAASDLGKTFIDRHALFLTGGDVYGYDASVGIRRYLLEERLARPRGGGKMPAIMGTNIYDLHLGPLGGRDYADLGYRACGAASSRPVPQGTVGAGTGATVGPFFEARGLKGTKGGIGSSASRIGAWTVGALVVTNCVGNVYDLAEQRTIAGTHRAGARGFLEMDDLLGEYLERSTTRFGTTIGVLGTDAPLDHEQLARLVELAHDGIALAIRPAHMSTDGDTLLGFCTGRRRTKRLDYRAFDVLHHVAVREVARAAVHAVRHATGLGGYEGLADSR